MGGHLAGKRIHDACLAAGVPVWHGGMLETGVGRAANLALAALPVIVYLVTIIVIGLKRAKRDKALVEEAAAPDPSVAASAEEEAALKEKLTTALGQLKQATGGKGGYLYELPWYMIIGNPAAGKSSAVARSGLTFPIPGNKALQGVGGTRNCDWFFTTDGILLDTAGRYSVQDNVQETDRAEWFSFLDLLKKAFPQGSPEELGAYLDDWS